MKLAILFWYYKNLNVCINRVELLKIKNPGVEIYGLYGGEPQCFPSFDSKLSLLLSGNYCFPRVKSSNWKWVNGDRLIIDWFRSVGCGVNFDSLVIVQWDFVAFDGIESIDEFKKDVLYISGLRPISEVRETWSWVNKSTLNGDEFERYADSISGNNLPDSEFLACNFAFAVLPRGFLEKYADIAADAPGFLEYRIPTNARIWGFQVRDLPRLRCIWFDAESKSRRVTFNADNVRIGLSTILFELIDSSGARFFHPVMGVVPRGFAGIIMAMIINNIRDFFRKYLENQKA